MSYGNQSVASYNRAQYLTVDGNSDSVTLSPKCLAFSVYATAACWIKFGPGSQTAAAPGAEKTAVTNSIFVPASTVISAIRIQGTDDALPTVAAIQDSGGGTLHVYEHFDF